MSGSLFVGEPALEYTLTDGRELPRESRADWAT